MITLRPFQQTMRDQRNASHAAGARAVLIQAPTGAGKTVMFAESAGSESGKVLILAHRKELIRQALDKLYAAGVPCSPYPSATPARVQVGSVQTLARREMAPFARIIVDEAYHAISPGYRRILDAQPDAIIDGYTATPERLDGQGLGDVFDHLVTGPSIRTLIDAGYLVRPRMFGAEDGPDLAGVRTIGGDFSAVDLSKAMNKPKLTGDMTAHYESVCPGAPAVVFCASVQHAHDMAKAFRGEGWSARAVWGGMPEDERAAVFAGLATGRVCVVTSCSLIDEGLDIPAISCVIDAAPTKSLSRYMQRGGRGMRPAAGKDRFFYLDHAGNAFQHGFLTMDREWTLDGVRRRPSDAKAVAQCPECFALHPPAPVCPECGHDYTAAAARAARQELATEVGRLTEMTEDDLRLQHLRTAPLKELVQGATMLDLEAIAEARGYHSRWAETTMNFKRRAAGRAVK